MSNEVNIEELRRVLEAVRRFERGESTSAPIQEARDLVTTETVLALLERCERAARERDEAGRERDEARQAEAQMKLEVFEACEESHLCGQIAAEYGVLIASAPHDGVRALGHRYESAKEQLDKQLAHSAKLFRDVKAFAAERDTLAAQLASAQAALSEAGWIGALERDVAIRDMIAKNVADEAERIAAWIYEQPFNREDNHAGAIRTGAHRGGK